MGILLSFAFLQLVWKVSPRLVQNFVPHSSPCTAAQRAALWCTCPPLDSQGPGFPIQLSLGPRCATGPSSHGDRPSSASRVIRLPNCRASEAVCQCENKGSSIVYWLKAKFLGSGHQNKMNQPWFQKCQNIPFQNALMFMNRFLFFFLLFFFLTCEFPSMKSL